MNINCKIAVNFNLLYCSDIVIDESIEARAAVDGLVEDVIAHPHIVDDDVAIAMEGVIVTGHPHVDGQPTEPSVHQRENVDLQKLVFKAYL